MVALTLQTVITSHLGLTSGHWTHQPSTEMSTLLGRCAERSFEASEATRLPEALKAACSAAFGRATPTPSLLQAQVGSALEQIGLIPQHEVRIPEGCALMAGPEPMPHAAGRQMSRPMRAVLYAHACAELLHI